MAAYAAATGVVRVVSRTAGATRATAVGTPRALSGTSMVFSYIRRLLRISAPTGTDGGVIMAIGEGGTTVSSSSDELDT